MRCADSRGDLRDQNNLLLLRVLRERVRQMCASAFNDQTVVRTHYTHARSGDAPAARSYRAMLCIRGTSHRPVSVCVCPSVTSRCSTKTAKHRITQTTPHDTPGTLVFRSQRSPRNSTGVTPYGGAKCRWGGSKSATFDK